MNREELERLVGKCEELAIYGRRATLTEDVYAVRKRLPIVAQLGGALLSRALADVSPEELRALIDPAAHPKT